MSAMIRTNHEHVIFFDIRQESNTCLDFVEFILAAINQQYIKQGDILIMDNASVHSGEDCFIEVLELLEELQVDVRYLPTYSPELNPIELVFGTIKNNIKFNRTQHTLLDAILEGVTRLTQDTIVSSYAHVINRFLAAPFNFPPCMNS